MRVDVLEEFELRRRRPDDENGIDAVECSRHLTKESVRIVRVFSRLATSFRVPVEMVLRRKNCRFDRGRRMDVKHASFLVIHPDDGVRWHALIVPQKHGMWNGTIVPARVQSNVVVLTGFAAQRRLLVTMTVAEPSRRSLPARRRRPRGHGLPGSARARRRPSARTHS